MSALKGMLTREEAAARVGRSVRTIRSWQAHPERPLRTLLGLIPEGDLLEYDRRMRESVGRPRKARDLDAAARAIVAGLGGRWLVLLKPREGGDPEPLAFDDMEATAQEFWRDVAASRYGGSGS